MQLSYAPLSAYREADKFDKLKRAETYAALNRLNVLYMIQRAGSGHIGSSFSSMEIITWMLLEHPEITFFSSKGHDCPAFYTNLIALEKLPFDMLHKLRRINGLPGHPELKTPGIIASGGSLGMGISKAKGLIRANRLRGIDQRVAVLVGDGELQEGQIWEALRDTAHLQELIIVVDQNGQSTERLKFDWLYCSIFEDELGKLDGHDFEDIEFAIENPTEINRSPTILTANTIKGKGISFLEDTPKSHSGALSEADYEQATDELLNDIRFYLPAFEAETCEYQSRFVIRETGSVLSYKHALYQEAIMNPAIVVLDADLAVDCGLDLFREEFPERFIECGIAEQDMVSQAGGLASQGLIPIVHTFAAFLTRRANEQIYDNCCQNVKVIYVGSLAGRLADGPGPSHEALDDIALMKTMPNMEIIQPGHDVHNALYYAINQTDKSVYLRLVANQIEEARIK